MTSSGKFHAIITKSLFAAVLCGLAGSIPLTRADVTPILEYRLGEDDSPNAIGSPATDPGKARTGGSIEISSPADITGLVLESSDQLPRTSWSPVAGITNNRFTIVIGPGAQFYRLRKQ